MKILLPLILVAVACGTANTSPSDKVFTIPSFADTANNPFNDTANHKPGDVEIFRLLGKDTAYIARLYRLDHGDKRNYETIIVENTNYDQGSYQWMNDSTISFYLIDSKNNKRKGFTLTGSGGTTTVADIN
jgi:hypothetical protein